MPHPRPITYDKCDVCQKLVANGLPKPIIGNFIPQRSLNDINNSRFHNWYFFTLGYSPAFVDYIIKSKNISKDDVILDPFVGSGTTVVESKLQGIPSIGIDANDFLAFASLVKTRWDLDLNQIKIIKKNLLNSLEPKMASIPTIGEQKKLFDFTEQVFNNIDIDGPIQQLIDRRYMSKLPLHKSLLILSEIEGIDNQNIKDFYKLALYSILVPASNVRYGPGFGIGPIKQDVDVLGLFLKKTSRMISDLESISINDAQVPSKVILGDSRRLSKVLKNTKVDYVITSPPYPGDHEYTRHTRLELQLSGMAKDKKGQRLIKERMVRSSTRAIYKVDNETSKVLKFAEIRDIMEKIDQRVKETNGTSGFEKLYSKLAGEYFGGMYEFLMELKKILSNGGIASLLVGDSHAFKMVHIETARLLGDLAIDVGFSSYDIELWWNKRSTSHSFCLPENILNIHN